MGEPGDKTKDILGRVYEYFLSGFAGAEGKRGGESYTPQSVVRTSVEMLEPFPDPTRKIEGRVYDPCCGSSGMFVQAERFVEAHGGRLGDIAIYGQESNYTTWRLDKMQLAVRGIDADIRWNNEGSFHKDELTDLRFDYILANPPFNWTLMSSYPVAIPPTPVCEVFEQTVAPLIEKNITNVMESRTLTATRDLLLPQLMSGEIRVREADAIVQEVARV